MPTRHILLVSKFDGTRFVIVVRTHREQESTAAILLRRHNKGSGKIILTGNRCLAADGTEVVLMDASLLDEHYNVAALVEVGNKIETCLLTRENLVDNILLVGNFGSRSKVRITVLPTIDLPQEAVMAQKSLPGSETSGDWCPRCGDVRLSADPVFDATEPLTGRRICTPCAKIMDLRALRGR